MKTRQVVIASAAALCAVQVFAAHTEVTKVPRLPFMRGMGFFGFYGYGNDQYARQASVMATLKAKGFDHVRLPVDFRLYSTYDSSTGVATLLDRTYVIPSESWAPRFYAGFSDFDTVITNAINAGLYVTLDFHGWFDIDPTNASSTNQFVALWKAVAERYKDYPNQLIFELANEPNTHDYSRICALQKNAVKEIRKTNPTRLILFDPGDASQPWVLTQCKTPPNTGWVSLPQNDNNIAVVVHSYNPGWFTHQGESWASNPNMTKTGIDEQYYTGTNSQGVAQYTTARNTLKADLKYCQQYLDATGVPLVMNEFNVSHRIAEKADITEYLSMITRWCESNNVPWSPWIYFSDGGGMDCFTSGSGTLTDYTEAGLFPDLKTTDKFSASDYPHTIDITFSGYAGSSALANFPVLVKLSERLTGFHYSDFTRADGFDLCFTDASGNLIPHEIDTWNTNGVSTVWVKVPSLAGTTTKIVARYGCAKPIVPKVESVWDSDFVAVWHMGEPKLPLADSSNVSRDLTAADGAGLAYGVSGVAGGSVDFGASGGSRGLFADDHANLDGHAKLTVEAWTYQKDHATNAGILSKRKAYGNQVSYYLYDNGSTTTFQVSSNGTTAVSCGVNLSPVASRWNHQAYTIDTTTSANNASGYLDGTHVNTATASVNGPVFSGTGELCIGNMNSGNAANFPGRIDEVRISKCVRSADWIKASYDTVANASFATYAVDGVVSTAAPEEQDANLVPSDVVEYDTLDQSAFAKKMTVSFTGYSGTALTDFPVLVKLSTAIDGFSYSDFQKEDGGDLRFADSNGTLLSHEIDTWNESGVSTVWVKVPSLSASATITACYGCANPPAVDPKDVWDDGYVGVWHLGEIELPMKESSGVSTDFASKNNTVLFGQGGAVGGAVDFSSGTSNNYLVANDDPDLDGFSDFTVEMWTYQEAYRTDSNYAALIAKRDGAYNGESFFAYQNNAGTRNPVFAFNTNSTGSARTSLSATARPEVGEWTHNAFTRNAGNGALAWYLDGATKGSGSAHKAAIYDGSTTLKLGGGGGQQSFPGKIDEVRISKVARSAAWVKATHDTVADANFATYSVQGVQPQPSDELLDTDAYANSMDVTFSGYSGTTLTDFPVLVKLSTAISGFSYDGFAMQNGGDLRFADSTGKLLPHEIDSWNSNDVSTVWVKVPSLTSTTTIKAYWGCTGTPQAVDPKDVWDDGYVAVWHLGESAVPLKESSETTSDFTTTNGTGIAFASQGIVGGSVDFVNGNNCSVVAPDHDLLDGFSKFTIEVWTWQDTLGTNLGILSKRNSSTSEAAYYIMQSGTQTPLCMQTNSTVSAAWISAPFPTAQAWNHLAYAVDTTSTSSNVRSYKNGGTPSTSSKTFTTGAMLSNGRDLVLGNLGKTAGYTFNGKIDEVRISNVVRSGDWIKATHDTVTMANFATYTVNGYQPAVPDRILYINVDAGVTDTLNASLVTAYITNIVKTGSGTLVASPISGYAGAFDIQGGVFQVSNAGDCGAAGTVINVRDGASLLFKGGANTVLDGKTVNLYGAKNSALRGKIQCETTNNQHLGSGFTLNLFSDATLYGYSVNYQLWPTSVDLNGHELVLAASGNWLTVRLGGEIADGGAVTFSNSTCYVESTGATPSFSATGASNSSLRLRAGAVMNCKQAVPSNGWTLDCSGSNIRGNMLKWPKETNVPVWDGPIVCSGASTIASYSSGSAVVSNTVFNAKGAFSGSGTLAVGPGWLNLHSANNTYSGVVTVTGKTADQTATGHVGPGGGGIGLWNGAACFPDASSVTFTNTARLAFMDNTACTVPNVTFVALADETQSISGGVYTARSTMAGFTKTGAGTLVFDSPVSVTGTGNVQAGTLKVANLSAMGSTVEEMVAPQPVFSTLAFASGTTLDLSGNYGFKVANLVGSPAVTNAGVFGVMGSWTLSSPVDVLTVTGENVVLGSDDISGMLAFASGATFTLADEVAFSNAVEAAGADGLVVARARWMLGESNLLGMQLALPTPAAGMSNRWSLSIGDSGTTLRLKLAPATGYAAWVAEKGVTGGPADKTGEIENAVRYAFDIDPQTDEIGDPPIIQVVMDESDNPAVRSRDLAEGRDDVTFGILATEDLGDWSDTALVPMEKSVTDGLWRPAASENPSYVYPAQMFFKYTIEVR